MCRTHRDRRLEIRAHPHRQAGDPVRLGHRPQQPEIRQPGPRLRAECTSALPAADPSSGNHAKIRQRPPAAHRPSAAPTQYSPARTGPGISPAPRPAAPACPPATGGPASGSRRTDRPPPSPCSSAAARSCAPARPESARGGPAISLPPPARSSRRTRAGLLPAPPQPAPAAAPWTPRSASPTRLRGLRSVRPARSAPVCRPVPSQSPFPGRSERHRQAEVKGIAPRRQMVKDIPESLRQHFVRIELQRSAENEKSGPRPALSEDRFVQIRTRTSGRRRRRCRRRCRATPAANVAPPPRS